MKTNALVLLLPVVFLSCTSEPRDRHGPANGSPHALRVLAYNIHHGEGMDKQLDLERIATLIKDSGADVVTLQEIDEGCKRTGGVDQATRLGKLTGMHHAFGPFFDYQGGRYGMALLSKRPLENVRNIRLPDGAEPRTALVATVTLDGGRRVTIAGIHLYRTGEERLAQADKLMASLADEPHPTILAGDFNSRPGDPVMRALGRRYVIVPKNGSSFTFPSTGPNREIDYLLIRRDAPLQARSCRVLDERVASDHRPLLTDLAWTERDEP